MYSRRSARQIVIRIRGPYIDRDRDSDRSGDEVARDEEVERTSEGLTVSGAVFLGRKKGTLSEQVG